MSEIQMMKRAIALFPRRDYTDAGSVRHLRRQWLSKIVYLRSQTAKGWILDHKVELQKEAMGETQ